MAEILTKAGCFVAIIVLGWVLRRIGFFKEGDFQVLSKIVLRITLPASIVYSFSDKEIDPSMLLLSVFGLALGIGYIGIGYLIAIGKSKEQKAFSILNISGYNIGNFTMPFAQGFLGPAGVVTTSLFDTGNAFICLGVSYSMAAMVQRGEKFSVLKILRDLCKSVPFVTYITMALLALLHVHLPSPVIDFAGLIGNANAPMAMLMLGVGFKISGTAARFILLLKSFRCVMQWQLPWRWGAISFFLPHWKPGKPLLCWPSAPLLRQLPPLPENWGEIPASPAR